ncbi:hypothetical protein [Paenibacillus aestuarii]|uniref:Uncharacterized protein n=1 Tax=Paenibacillus aestuarii TaxID=516965 RepID=A0ABW0KCY9_9BACL|nr:hypothetical protein [Paenibacillus aestuarii]
MKQHDVVRFMKQPADLQVAHFSCAPGYLDIYSLRYRWFGAVWTLNEQNQRVVSGYWFGNNREDVVEQALHEGWNSFIEVAGESSIKSIYETFRRRQQEIDWHKRSLLINKSLFSKVWKTAKSGWYIIKSRDHFPFYISSVKKKGHLVYLEHADICENEAEIRSFINKVNEEHQIKLPIAASCDIE